MDRQSRLAVESRAYPVFRFNPDAGPLIGDCAGPGGQPGAGRRLADDRAGRTGRNYLAGPGEKAVHLYYLALPRRAGAKHFHPLKPADAEAGLIPFADLVALPESEREGRVLQIEVLQLRPHRAYKQRQHRAFGR